MSDFDDILAELEEEKSAGAASALAATESVDPLDVSDGFEAEPRQPTDAGLVRAEHNTIAEPESMIDRGLRGLREMGASVGSWLDNQHDTDPYTYRAMTDPNAGPLPQGKPLTLGTLNSLVAGGVHGRAVGLERALPQWTGPVRDAVRDWSIDAENYDPETFAGGDIMQNALPGPSANTFGKVTNLIKPSGWKSTLGRFAADVAAQTGIGVVDSATRKWADDPNLDYQDAVVDSLPEGAVAGATSLPGAAISALAARSHVKQTVPEQMLLRQTELNNAKVRSAGMDPTLFKSLDPDKQQAILAKIDELRLQGGDGWSDVPDVATMNQRARLAADAQEVQKDAALDTLAAQNAGVSQVDLANNLRAQRRPGAGDAVRTHNALIDGVANRYDPPAQVPPMPQQDMLPGAPPAPVSATPARPSVRYNPSAPPGGPSVAAPGPQAPPDPVGALAAQAPSPPPGGFYDGEGNYFPPPEAPTPPPALDVPGFVNEKELVGRKVDKKAVPTPEDDIKAERYAALMDAARKGFGAVDPQAANAWDVANTNEGLLRHIQEGGQAAADSAGQKWLTRALGFSSAASPLAVGVLTSVGTPASLALGAGLATAAWAQPRAGALQAKWLSKDTSAMMNRLSNYGSKPYGSLTSGFGDMLRDPPPSAAESSDVDSGTTDKGETSSLSPGEFLGRDTTQAMLDNSQLFMPYADDYSQAGTDDRRAAVTERLYRTDPQFAANVFPTIRGGTETA